MKYTCLARFNEETGEIVPIQGMGPFREEELEDNEFVVHLWATDSSDAMPMMDFVFPPSMSVETQNVIADKMLEVQFRAWSDDDN